jgi:hypothetical protein
MNRIRIDHQAPLRGPEADLPRDHLDRLGAGLDVQPRRLGPQALDGLGGGLAGLDPEGAPELTRASQVCLLPNTGQLTN